MATWNSTNNVGFVAEEVDELDHSMVKYEFHDPKPNSIKLNAGSDTMIAIADDGFYVRGVKVPQDDKEAETVYNAFKQWLAWANLSR